MSSTSTKGRLRTRSKEPMSSSLSRRPRSTRIRRSPTSFSPAPSPKRKASKRAVAAAKASPKSKSPKRKASPKSKSPRRTASPKPKSPKRAASPKSPKQKASPKKPLKSPQKSSPKSPKRRAPTPMRKRKLPSSSSTSSSAAKAKAPTSTSSSASKSPRKKRKIQFGDVEAKEIEARSKTSGTSSAYTVLSSQATGGDSVFRRFDVARAMQMREFLKENGLKFERGATFCRITSKPQILTRGRRVVMVSREDVGEDPDVFEDGAKCRELLKIKGDAKHEITDASAPNYEIYVSSSVPSKPLEEGTTFLYRVPDQLEGVAPTVNHPVEVDTPKKIEKKEDAPSEDGDADDEYEEEGKKPVNAEDMPVDSRTFLTNPDTKTFWELTLRGSAHVITTGKIGPKPRGTPQSKAKKGKQNLRKTPQKRKRPSENAAPENAAPWPPSPLTPATPLTNVKTVTHMWENADEATFKAEQEIMKKQKEGFMTAIQVKRRRRERRIEKKIDEADSSAHAAAQYGGAAAPSPTASAKKKVRFFETQLFKGKQFWHCRVLPTEIVVRSGRIGSQGKSVVHKCRNVHSSTKKARTLIASQKKAGYVSWAESVQK